MPYEDLYPDDDQVAAFAHFRELTRSYAGRSRPTEAPPRAVRDGAGRRKVVGVGSVGTRAWILLLEGVDGQDPLFLQAKEAGPSVLDGYCPRAAVPDQGERVVPVST